MDILVSFVFAIGSTEELFTVLTSLEETLQVQDQTSFLDSPWGISDGGNQCQCFFSLVAMLRGASITSCKQNDF